MAAPLLLLPHELLLDIVSLLSDASLARLITTCHRLHNILFPLVLKRGLAHPFPNNSTFLHWASQHSLPRLCRTLRTNDSRLLRNKHGETPLHYPAATGNTSLLSILLPPHPGEHTFLPDYHPSLDQRRITCGLTVCHWRHRDALTPLHLAVLSRSLESVRLLLAAGACTGHQDDFGWSPIMRAAAAGDADIVDAICKAGRNPNQRDAGGLVPVHAAAMFARAHVLDVLRNRWFALVGIEDWRGTTPLDFARCSMSCAEGAVRPAENREECARLLEGWGAKEGRKVAVGEWEPTRSDWRYLG